MSKLDERTSGFTSRLRHTPTGDGSGGGWRRYLRITALGAAALVGLVIVVVTSLVVLHRGTALPGTVVAGVDVGGQSRDGVRTTLDALLMARQSDSVVLAHEGREFAFVPGGDAYDADISAAVNEAMSRGREANPLRAGWTHLSTLWGASHTITLSDDLLGSVVDAWVDEVADVVDHEPFPGRITADPESLEVRVAYPTAGERVMREQSAALIHAAIRVPGEQRRDLPVEVLPQEVAEEDVDRVAAQAERALAEPLVLRAHDSEIVLEPPDIARLIDSRPTTDGDRATIELHVPPTVVADVFEPYEQTLSVEPRDARFEVRSRPIRFDAMSNTSWSQTEADVEVIPSTPGSRLDPELAAAQLTGLFVDGVREADLALEAVEADFTSDAAHDLNVTHLIGTFTTYHACCQSRVTNIQRMADLVRGVVLLPGETFSVNGHVGPRTRAKGFAEGGTIVRGEFVSEVGGGVSQFATTMYNAAFFAGIEIPEHKAHSFYISRYPMGREATLYYPMVDLKITNTTPNGIIIHTSYTGTSITVSLYGNTEGITVRAEHGSPFNQRTRSEIVRENKDLRPGQERVIQGSGQGFDVVVHRHIERPGGDTTSERIFTRYEAQPRIVERNSDEPEPEPEPSPEPSPTDAPSPPPDD